MRAIRSLVSLTAYQQELVDVIRSDDSVVFLDTNLLAWGFRLNDAAMREFIGWLGTLQQRERLIIPAWTVHEYNHHLFRNDPAFFFPYKAVGKQLNANLAELERVAHLMISDASATEFGYTNRDDLFSALSEASKTIQKLLANLAKNDVQRREDFVNYLETLIARCALKSNIQELAHIAASETSARYANRLSPGYNDVQKKENSGGDFIIWKEILGYCCSKNIMKAVLITNDRKPDWVYTPPSVVLPNGVTVSGNNKMARLVKLPKPELIAEFECFTGSTDFHIFTIESVIEVFSSAVLNIVNAQDFRHLALAIRLDLARTPTEAVIQWFLKNPDRYAEALHSVCRWEQSPAEVDQKAFEEWTVEKMKNVDPQNVSWIEVFCELFL